VCCSSHIGLCTFYDRNYPHMTKPAAPGQLRIAAHTDYGTITILRADNCPGKSLQVRRATLTCVPPPSRAQQLQVLDGRAWDSPPATTSRVRMKEYSIYPLASLCHGTGPDEGRQLAGCDVHGRLLCGQPRGPHAAVDERPLQVKPAQASSEKGWGWGALAVGVRASAS
jgi:hypothetical protein